MSATSTVQELIGAYRVSILERLRRRAVPAGCVAHMGLASSVPRIRSASRVHDRLSMMPLRASTGRIPQRLLRSGIWRGFSLHSLAGLTPAKLTIASLGLALFDWGDQIAGVSLFPGGALDECAHVLTTVLILWALGPRVWQRFLVPAVIASVAIDLDHVPGQLGMNWLTAGTPRPYTHSLLTIALVLAAALLVRPRRDALLGVALGLASHFFRDLAEPGTGVALLWPWSYHSFSLPHATYVLIMATVVLAGALRLFAPRRRRARPSEVVTPSGLGA
jgi:inner membrane protein